MSAAKLYNLDYLKELAAGDNTFMLEMINYFVANSPQVLEQMDTLVKNKDWAMLREVIHKFTPNMNLIGLKSAINEANNLEILAENRKDPDKIPVLVGFIREKVEIVIAQLKEDFDI
ncbi:MAG: Hpt domain-containing protein [Bacteroidales bacterium]|nr:Hpt domain-containing protein [Bacteroidales bacterium]